MKKILATIIMVLSITFTMGCSSVNNQLLETNKVVVYCMECAEENNETSEFCPNCGKSVEWSVTPVTLKEEIPVVEEETTEEETVVVEEEPVVEEVKTAPVKEEPKVVLYGIDGVYNVYDGTAEYIDSQTNEYLNTIPRNPDGCFSENGRCFQYAGTSQWTRLYLCNQCHGTTTDYQTTCQECLDMEAEAEWFDSVGNCTVCGGKLAQDYSGVGTTHDSCK